MTHKNPRAQLLNAIYKNQYTIVEQLLPTVDPKLIKEALKVCTEYGHVECCAALIPYSKPEDRYNLLESALESEEIHSQQQMIELLVPYNSSTVCSMVFTAALEWGKDELLPSLLQGVDADEHNTLTLDWAASRGRLSEVEDLVDLCEDGAIARALFLACENFQWDVVKFLIPMSDPYGVLLDFDTEEMHSGGNYAKAREGLLKVMDEVNCEQQKQRLTDEITADPVAVKRKM